jgi:inactivated superfamily I helicase
MQLMDQEIVKIIFSTAELAQFHTWKKERLTKGKFIFEDADINDCTDVTDLQQLMKLLLNVTPTQCNDIPKATIENLKQLIRFIANKIQKRKDNNGSIFLLNQVSEVGKALNRLSQVVERHGNYIHDLESVEILYRLLCSNSAIKLNNSSTDGLQIMGLLETRNLDFKRLHLLSVNEGILPTDKQQGSFIPHFIRKAYGLPSYSEKQAVFAYHFYRLRLPYRAKRLRTKKGQL